MASPSRYNLFSDNRRKNSAFGSCLRLPTPVMVKVYVLIGGVDEPRLTKQEDTEMSVEATAQPRSGSRRTWLPVLVLTLIIAVPAFLLNPIIWSPAPGG